MERTGTIYSEMTNKGRSSVRYVQGCKPIYCFNWVAEIQINGHRFRKRSKSRGVVERWLEEIKVRYGSTPIVTGAASPKYQKNRVYGTQYKKHPGTV